MLENHPQNHLSDDEMLQALIDTGDLGTKRRSHLSQCDNCQKELVSLEQRFDHLAKTARRLAPAPQKPFRLPLKATRQRSGWRLAPMWAAAIAAVIVLVLWLPHQADRIAHIPTVARSIPAATDSLMDQVDMLVDNPLPPVLQEMAISTDWDDSGSVIDWVVPPIDNMDDDDSWT